MKIENSQDCFTVSMVGFQRSEKKQAGSAKSAGKATMFTANWKRLFCQTYWAGHAKKRNTQRKQNITHMWRWGTPQNFFLAFTDELKKQIIIKTVEVGQQKTNSFNIYKVKKLKKNSCRYHYQNLDDMIYSSWDIEQNKLIYTCAPKLTIIWCMVSEILSETDKTFCHFGPFCALLLLPPNDPEYQNFENMKKMPGDIILLYTHVYYKWRSYGIWFLKYKVRQTDIFNILGHFFALLAPWQTGK